MKVVFRDKIGYVQVEVNEYGVSFLDGQAMFEDGDDREYRIDINNLVSIE